VGRLVVGGKPTSRGESVRLLPNMAILGSSSISDNPTPPTGHYTVAAQSLGRSMACACYVQVDHAQMVSGSRSVMTARGAFSFTSVCPLEIT
jgi:hypothetical protein